MDNAEKNKKFNLEDFYIKNEQAAVGIIAPDESIYEYVDERHYKTIEQIYAKKYENFEGFLKSQKNYRSWREEALDKGNIIMQLCSEVLSLIYFPERINERQYNEMKKFVNDIININLKLKDKEKSQIAFETNIPGLTILAGDDINKIITEIGNIVESKNTHVAEDMER